MKPDQHKKKRSTQYKKKHGMKTGDSKEENNVRKQPRRGQSEISTDNTRDGNVLGGASAAGPKTAINLADEDVLNLIQLIPL